jgi:hypothetical protein
MIYMDTNVPGEYTKRRVQIECSSLLHPRRDLQRRKVCRTVSFFQPMRRKDHERSEKTAIDGIQHDRRYRSICARIACSRFCKQPTHTQCNSDVCTCSQYECHANDCLIRLLARGQVRSHVTSLHTMLCGSFRAATRASKSTLTHITTAAAK